MPTNMPVFIENDSHMGEKLAYLMVRHQFISTRSASRMFGFALDWAVSTPSL